jgi:hypothetical protein
MTVAFLTGDYRYNPGTGFKSPQNMLGLQPSRTGDQNLLHCARQPKIRNDRPGATGGRQRLARARTIGAYKHRDFVEI